MSDPQVSGVGAHPARLTAQVALIEDPRMSPGDDLDAREAERTRRRDHAADAERRDLMRSGMGKVFKQIQDVQRKAADEIVRRRRNGSSDRKRP